MIQFFILRYFNFEPSFKLRWYCARDLFVSQIPVNTGGFELRISFIRSSYLTQYAEYDTIAVLYVYILKTCFLGGEGKQNCNSDQCF